MSGRRGVFDPVSQDLGGGLRKLPRWVACPLRHVLQDLKQAPALASVTLGGKGAFSFEVHVVDQGVTARRRLSQALEVVTNLLARSTVRLCQHFRQRFLEAVNQELCLKVHRAGKEVSKLFHLGRLLGAQKVASRMPRTRPRKEGKCFCSSLLHEMDEFGKAFIKRAGDAFGIPNEVTDAKRSKILSGVPRGQPRDRSIAFVLPNFMANAAGL